jgi:hypothetical protein
VSSGQWRGSAGHAQNYAAAPPVRTPSFFVLVIALFNVSSIVLTGIEDWVGVP